MFYKNGSIIRQLILLRLLAGGGTPSETFTVTGVSPLSLVNAIAHRLVSLTQYGKCVLRDPDVPDGWVRVEHLRSSGDAYLDLGYKGGQNTKAKVRYRYHTTSSATGSGRVLEAEQLRQATHLLLAHRVELYLLRATKSSGALTANRTLCWTTRPLPSTSG